MAPVETSKILTSHNNFLTLRLNSYMFCRLPFPHMNRLASLLDRRQRDCGDWVELAELLGVPQCKIKTFKRELDVPHNSPTVKV